MKMQTRKGVPQGLTPKPKPSAPSLPSVPKVKTPSPKLFTAKAKEVVKPAQRVTALDRLFEIQSHEHTLSAGGGCRATVRHMRMTSRAVMFQQCHA